MGDAVETGSGGRGDSPTDGLAARSGLGGGGCSTAAAGLSVLVARLLLALEVNTFVQHSFYFLKSVARVAPQTGPATAQDLRASRRCSCAPPKPEVPSDTRVHPRRVDEAPQTKNTKLI